MVDRRQFFAITNLLKVRSALAAEMGMETKILKVIHVSLYPLKRQYDYQWKHLVVWLHTSQSLGTFSPLGKVLKVTGKGCSEESHGNVGGFCGGPFKTIEALYICRCQLPSCWRSLLGRTSTVAVLPKSKFLCSRATIYPVEYRCHACRRQTHL